MSANLVLAWRGTWHYPHRDGIYVNCRLTRCGRTVPVESVVITSAASVDPAAICKQCADCTNPPENQEEGD